MTEQENDRFISLLLSVLTAGVLACGFFWVSSCQRTEIIKACFEYATDKANCIKGMP